MLKLFTESRYNVGSDEKNRKWSELEGEIERERERETDVGN